MLIYGQDVLPSTAQCLPSSDFHLEAFLKLEHSNKSLGALAGNADSGPVGLDGKAWFKQGTVPSNHEKSG